MSVSTSKTRKARVADGEPSAEAESGTKWEDFKWLMTYARSIWGLFALVLLFSFLSSASRSGMAYFIKPFMNDVLGKRSISTLQWIALNLAWIAVVAGLTQYFYLYLSRKVKELMMLSIRCDVFERLLHLPLSFYAKNEKGDLISRVTNDIRVSRRALHSVLTKFVKEPMTAIVAIGLMLMASVQLTVVALVIAPIIVFPILRFANRVKKSKKQSLHKLGDVVESINQVLSGIRVVRIFQAEDREKDYFRQTNESLLDKNLNVIHNKALSRSILRLGIGLLLACFIFGGAYYTLTSDSLTFGDFSLFIVGLWMLYQPVRKLAKTYNRFLESLAGVRRVRELLSRDHLTENVPDGPDEIDGIEDGIALRNVTFAYDDSAVLHDVNLDIDRKDVVALVGPSGAGKSTLMDIIARFYHPESGQITVDGKPVEQIDLDSYIDLLAVVSQDAYLFNTTIKENIGYGTPGAGLEEIQEATKMAHIHDFITSLDDGYETSVGERGVRVSGGQKQRLTIARAILQDPELLLLDEATSDLDSHSEQAIQDAMNTLLQDRTCVVIAHRLSTVMDADKIVVLDEGRIVQKGTHAQLLERDGLYRELYDSQFDPDNGAP